MTRQFLPDGLHAPLQFIRTGRLASAKAEMSALRPDLLGLKATVDALVERMGAQ